MQGYFGSNSLFLVVNVGSATVKTRLFDSGLRVKALLNADYGNAKDIVIEGQNINGDEIAQRIVSGQDAKAALAAILEIWRQLVIAKGLQLSAIGHRVVHGGRAFDAVTVINQDVLKSIAQLDNYAPLHNPPNRLGIAMAAEVFPEVLQFAVFDTAFHRRIPDYAGRYAIPQNLSHDVDFYRYGFHGISCQYSLWAAAELLAREQASLNLIVLHLGGGASVTAIRAGISIDTSMGFSPTEGLIMASRCGDLDPMIVITLQQQGLSLQQLNHLLNHESGLFGICGVADMREVLKKAEQGDQSAVLAVEMFCYRIRKYIGAYCAVLGDVSALIFTGGIGEHAPIIRHNILQDMDKLGFSIDPTANRLQADKNCDISQSSSYSRILVIHAEEEREIARQILAFPG